MSSLPLHYEQRRHIDHFASWIKQESFSHLYQHLLGAPEPPSILTPLEQDVIRSRLQSNEQEIKTDYEERHRNGRDLFLVVRQRLLAILQMWDAVINETSADLLGLSTESMRSFLLCVEMIPNRFHLGFPPPPSLQVDTTIFTPSVADTNDETASMSATEPEDFALSDNTDDNNDDDDDEDYFDPQEEDDDEEEEEFEELFPVPNGRLYTASTASTVLPSQTPPVKTSAPCKDNDLKPREELKARKRKPESDMSQQPPLKRTRR